MLNWTVFTFNCVNKWQFYWIVRDTQPYLEPFNFVDKHELFDIELLAMRKQKAVFMLDWIVWNRTVYIYKEDLTLINL